MRDNVVQFGPTAAAAVDEREPLEAAVLEASAEIASLIGRARRTQSRVYELKSAAPELRRRHGRAKAITPSAPVNFFSIEEAEASSQPEPLQAA